jgi:dihydroxyacetone kinase-like protein
MGIHGEPGITRTRMESADSVTAKMLDRILQDMPLVKGDEVSVLVNGLGATPKEELYIVHRKADKILKDLGVKIFQVYVGEFATSMEMSGFSLSVCKVDEELGRLLARPARTPFFEQIQL